MLASFVRTTALLLAGILFAGVFLVAGARQLSDGPIGPIPGGAMSGEPGGELALAFDHPLGAVIELQVNTATPRSLTVGALPHEGAVYVPAILAESKGWPREVEEDPRVVVRWEGKLYPHEAVRVRDPLTLDALRQKILAADTGSNAERLADPDTWFFRLEAPARGEDASGR